MMKIQNVQVISTNEVTRAIKVALENGKCFTAGFSATTPDFMIQRTNGVVASTTKSAVIASFKGHMDITDIKTLAEHINALRPVVFGKSTQNVNILPKVKKEYKATCACCGVGLTDKVIDFCNRKLFGEMVCFDCQKGPKGPKKEGASEASAPTPSSISAPQVSAQDSAPVADLLEDMRLEMEEIRKQMESDPDWIDSISVTTTIPRASEASVRTKCTKCDGSGKLHFYVHVQNGVCFRCKGRGYFSAKPKNTAPSSLKESEDVVVTDNEKTPISEQSSAEVGVVISNDAVAWTKSLEESLLESDLVADRN